MSQHSPEPWFACGDGFEIDDGSDIGIYSGSPVDGVFVASVWTSWPWHDDGNGGKDDVAEGRANARLIAAAPELLGMCRVILARARKHTDGSARFDAAWLDDLRAVIAKAEGDDVKPGKGKGG